jgi:nitrite reductase/ring-hydroxylating ferredoxin subunit
VDGEFHAIDAECSHEGGPLGQGMVFGHTVSCPWHFAEFDVRTGESLDDIAPCDVDSYRVVVEDGEVKAEIPG